MLPRWQVLVERWAISMSQVGKARDFDAVEEVAHVGVLAVDALGLLGLQVDLAERAVAVDELDSVGQHDLVGDDLEAAAVEQQAAVGAAEEDAVVMAVELQAVPLAHRVGQGASGELVDDLHGVGRVAVVVGGEDPAGRVDRLGPLGVEGPEHDVVEVNAPVAHHAAGIVEEPAEQQVEPVGVERPLGAGPSQRS